jgi:hypothetical protein
VALIWLPKWQAARLYPTAQERFAVENEARKTLAQIIGGAAVLFGLYFTWGSLEVNREGQITDRFTKAITQLGEWGPEKLAVRLGGIYALEADCQGLGTGPLANYGSPDGLRSGACPLAVEGPATVEMRSSP